MSERRQKHTTRNRMVAYIAAGVLHLAIIAALVINITSTPDTIEADFAEKVDVVKATTVDESEIQRKQNELKQKERDDRAQKERERRELERLKEQAKQEKERLEKLEEEKKKSQEEAAELEKQRKEILLKKQQEEAKAKKEREEREKRERERRRKEQQERERQKEQDRLRREQEELEARREMQERLAREEAMLAKQRAQERATTLSSKYAALIKRRVEPKITISPDFSPTLVSRMNVKLSSSGEVRTVRLIQSSGNSAYDRAVETAIYASSPLPIPSQVEDPEVNKMFRDLTLNFSISGQ